MAKAPKFPSYDDIVKNKSSKNKKSLKKKLYTKDEWEQLEEKRKQKERDRHKLSDKNRKKPITIAYRVSVEDRERIYKRIKMTGYPIGVFMTDSILNAPLKIVVTKKVADEIANNISELVAEVKTANDRGLIEKETVNKLNDIISYFQEVEVVDEQGY